MLTSRAMQGGLRVENMRIGHGYDAHCFTAGSFVTLGGVKIPYRRGLRAHSDGDVLLHALCDALLGGGGLGDIGHHFSDSDPAYRNIDSRLLLRRVRDLLFEHKLGVGNVDLTVIAQIEILRAPGQQCPHELGRIKPLSA